MEWVFVCGLFIGYIVGYVSVNYSVMKVIRTLSTELQNTEDDPSNWWKHGKGYKYEEEE